MEDKQYITIELEEYKNLLTIKGRYEELRRIDYGLSTAGYCEVLDKEVLDKFECE